MAIKNLLRPAALIWTIVVVYATVLPFDFSRPYGEIAAAVRHAISSGAFHTTKGDAVINLFLLAPLGWLLALASRFEGRGAVSSTLRAALGAAVLSASIEAAQVLSAYRVPSLFDFVLNTAGGFAGALAGVASSVLPWERIEGAVKHAILERPYSALAAAAAAGIWIAFLAPFDFTLDLGTLKHSVKTARPLPFAQSLRGDPFEFSLPEALGAVLLWSLAGGVLALSARELGRRNPALHGMAGAAILAFTSEFSQLFVRGRVPDATEIVWALAGGAAGAAAALGPGRHPPRLRRAALGGWALAIVLARWSPPEFSLAAVERFSWQRLVPLLAHVSRAHAGAAADLVTETLSFAPFGILLAAGNPSWTPRRAAAAGALTGLVLEAGQLFLPQRTADITDVLLAALGAAAGAWILSLRRALVAESRERYGAALSGATREGGPLPPEGSA